jgi:GNAT superfamily N-acetyltransferase
MMARAHPRLALRPYLAEDTPLLREILRDSIADLTDDDYTPAQQEAWASIADDEAAFGKRLASQLTLVGTLEGSAVGFASLAGPDKIDMLYVHPAAAGQGVGQLLLDALDALLDDLNTPKAFAALHELRSEAVKGAKPAAACLKASAQLIGLLRHSASEWASFRPASVAIDEIKVASLIDARTAARKAKNFAESDRIRDELAAMGVLLKDSKEGTTWEIAR